MNNFFEWLASSPLASWAKVFVASMLGWVIMNADSLGIHPALAMALVASLPVLVNWLNPADSRYGKEDGGE